MKKYVATFLFLYFLFFKQSGLFALNQANQNLSSNLPLVLDIEKIIVEGQKYDIDEFMKNMKIKSFKKINSQKSILELSPVSVKIRTNSASPIVVYAQFSELKHHKNLARFKDEFLSIYPSFHVINNPHNLIETNNFTPYAIVNSDIIDGLYDGILTFTLGVL